jgi:hypothetical protein
MPSRKTSIAILSSGFLMSHSLAIRGLDKWQSPTTTKLT